VLRTLARKVFFLPEARTSVFLAKGATTLCVETLPFEVGLADSTVEAFGVPVLPESLDPSVGRFDGEFAAVTFGGEQFVPVFRAILIPVLDVEARRADRLLAVEADETFWMPGLAHGIDAVVFDGSGAFGAFWREVSFVIRFAEELSSFFDEAAILQRRPAVGIRANEGVGRKRLTQSQDEWTSDLVSRHGADGDFPRKDGLLDLGASGRS